MFEWHQQETVQVCVVQWCSKQKIFWLANKYCIYLCANVFLCALSNVKFYVTLYGFSMTSLCYDLEKRRRKERELELYSMSKRGICCAIKIEPGTLADREGSPPGGMGHQSCFFLERNCHKASRPVRIFYSLPQAGLHNRREGSILFSIPVHMCRICVFFCFNTTWRSDVLYMYFVCQSPEIWHNIGGAYKVSPMHIPCHW